jgi:hypothetical protein
MTLINFTILEQTNRGQPQCERKLHKTSKLRQRRIYFFVICFGCGNAEGVTTSGISA